MIKIAFCDDNRSELDELQGLMNEYCLQSGQRIYCKAFEGSIELMTAMERGEQFDVLFLDIIMPGATAVSFPSIERSRTRTARKLARM